MTYSTDDDVFTFLSAQAFVIRPRPFEAVDIATGTIRLTAHGLSSLDSVLLTATSGGSLPTGVSAFQYYPPTVLGADLFRLVGFNSFASAGSGWSVSVDPARRLAKHRLDAFARINEHLTAHTPPLDVDPDTGLYPPIIIGLEARMAARAAVTSMQVDNAAYRVAVDRLFAIEEADQKILDAWLAGKPVQPRPVDQSSTIDNAAIAVSGRAPVGWSTGMM